MQRRFLLALSTLALAATLAAGPAAAQAGKDFKIALLTGKTGPLEAYARQTVTGFMMGLEYATGGTLAVAGRRPMPCAPAWRPCSAAPTCAASRRSSCTAETTRWRRRTSARGPTCCATRRSRARPAACAASR